MTYTIDGLLEEVAYVAYYLHWSMDTLLDLEHPLRKRLIEHVDRIDEQARSHRWG